MIEILIAFGWAFLVYLTGVILLLGYFFLPLLWNDKPSDPSGGLLVAFLSFGLIFLCVTWPVSIPIMIWQDFKEKRKKDIDN